MTYDPEDLELVVDHHELQSIESGHPPRHLGAWRAACRKEILANEALREGFIERAAAGLRARAAGRKLTYCKHVRGSHAVHHVYDPTGTDQPPAWWNRDEAKREYDSQRGKLRPPAEVEATASRLGNIGIEETK